MAACSLGMVMDPFLERKLASRSQHPCVVGQQHEVILVLFNESTLKGFESLGSCIIFIFLYFPYICIVSLMLKHKPCPKQG